MTNTVEWAATNMDMPVISTAIITSSTATDAQNVLKTCWELNQNCKRNVYIDGHVLFFKSGDSKSKLQYASTFHTVGRVYDNLPGK